MLLFALEIRGRKFLSFKSILSHRNLLGREIDLGPTMEEYVEEKGMMEEVRDTHNKMTRETCDCSIKQIPGFSFEFFKYLFL